MREKEREEEKRKSLTKIEENKFLYLATYMFFSYYKTSTYRLTHVAGNLQHRQCPY